MNDRFEMDMNKLSKPLPNSDTKKNVEEQRESAGEKLWAAANYWRSLDEYSRDFIRLRSVEDDLGAVAKFLSLKVLKTFATAPDVHNEK